MYNTQKPDIDDLPSSARLLKSTAIAAAAAGVILVTVVLPAEYGIDPTGSGSVLGLTQMGEIKSQLAEEAEMDRKTSQADKGQSRLIEGLLGLFVSTAHAQEAADSWDEEVSFTLAPGESTEYKLAMDEGAQVDFLWAAEGGVVNYDLHGDGDGQNISYEKGRGAPGDQGTLKAEFAGNHGWFWRNRDSQEVSITLSVRGDYQELKRAD
ncbi:transmembrane anchor protein [Granulosicoccus antarcticus]|uniref:Transmembrane anchor protein n=1 Tax=Granulosicoccus antarcticus IMCC3135 TaxID=1192854 RepID=A0A2Z2NZW4_9GAMM|nr:transmembrane anchor protein [Granulosicoccus antarcticus]ASJ73377.1 hypothetical protein IMCC3135_16475 [Granulosicoccus antarcticus IMCC3135]